MNDETAQGKTEAEKLKRGKRERSLFRRDAETDTRVAHSALLRAGCVLPGLGNRGQGPPLQKRTRRPPARSLRRGARVSLHENATVRHRRYSWRRPGSVPYRFNDLTF